MQNYWVCRMHARSHASLLITIQLFFRPTLPIQIVPALLILL